jgi:glycerophosphoryl diester phosphodiesterase
MNPFNNPAVALLLLLAPLPLVAAEPSGPLVVGHRGLMHSAPENTLAGFRACLALRVGWS